MEKNWKIITILNSVESQANCISERYLLVIIFLCKTWPKVVEIGELKSQVDFDLLIMIIFFYKNWSKVFKDGKFEPEIDRNYLII